MASNRDLVGQYLIQKVSAAAAAEFQRLTREERGQRDGQAFMNCLSLFAPEKYQDLTNTSWDPYYIDKNIRAAIHRLEGNTNGEQGGNSGNDHRDGDEASADQG